MDTDPKLTETDEGKMVKNRAGDEIGRVMSVEHGTAHVEPDPGLTDAIRSKLGWGDADEGTYELDQNNIDSITDDEIRLSM
jgi:hypothetical protein